MKYLELVIRRLSTNCSSKALVTAYLIINLLLTHSVIFGQNQNQSLTDSLNSMVNEKPKEAINMSFKHLKLCAKQDSDLISGLNGVIGKGYYLLGQVDSSLFYFKESLNYTPSNNHKDKANRHNNYGISLHLSQMWDEAYYHYNKTIEYAELNKDSSLLLRVYLNLGTLFNKIGDFDRALKSYYDGLKISKAIGDTLGTVNFYSGIGTIHYRTKNLSRAKEWYSKAYQLSLLTKNKRFQCNMLSNIGAVELDSDSLENAEDIYRKTLAIAENINHNYALASTLSNMGILKERQEKYESAEEYYIKAVDLSNKVGLKSVYHQAVINLSKLKLKQLKYSEAEITLNKIFESSASEMESRLQAAAYETLSQIYTKKNDYYHAYLNKKKAQEINDSLLNQEMYDKIANLRIKYEIEEQQKAFEVEKQLLEANKKREVLIRNILLISIFILLIGLFMFVKIYKLRQLNKIQKIKEEVVELRQKMLAQQLNPHFIFNTLNSIQYFINKNDKKASSEFLANFAGLMRASLDFSQRDFINLEEEIEFLKNYLDLEQQRLNKSFKYFVNIAENINEKVVVIPPFLIQPSVENAIKHGIYGKKNGLIEINFLKKEGALECSVKDNGIGIGAEVKDTNHISLANNITKRRMQILEKVYHKNASFSITDWSNQNEKGCIAQYNLPLMQVLNG